MNDQQINDIAREYGEYEANRIDYDMFRDPDVKYRIAAKGGKEKAKTVLEWLSSRYCLVEKGKVEDEYDEARTLCENVDPCGKSYARNEARMFLLERLFPEIGKEVEE